MISLPFSSFPLTNSLKILPRLSMPLLLVLLVVLTRSSPQSSSLSTPPECNTSLPCLSLPCVHKLKILPRRSLGGEPAETAFAWSGYESCLLNTEERRRWRFAQESFSSVVSVQSCSCVREGSSSSAIALEWVEPWDEERRRLWWEGSKSGSRNWILGLPRAGAVVSDAMLCDLIRV